MPAELQHTFTHGRISSDVTDRSARPSAALLQLTAVGLDNWGKLEIAAEETVSSLQRTEYFWARPASPALSVLLGDPQPGDKVAVDDMHLLVSANAWNDCIRNGLIKQHNATKAQDVLPRSPGSVHLAKWGSQEDIDSVDPPREPAANDQYASLPDLRAIELWPVAFLTEPLGQTLSMSWARAAIILSCLAWISRRCFWRSSAGTEDMRSSLKMEEHNAAKAFPGHMNFADTEEDEATAIATHIQHCKDAFSIASLGLRRFLSAERVDKAFRKGDRVCIGNRAATVLYGPDIDGEYMLSYDDDGKQSGFMKPDVIKEASYGVNLIELRPADTILFNSSGSSCIVVSNVSSGHVAFRFQCTAPNRYSVRPARMTLAPQEQCKVEILTKESQANCEDRFLLMATPLRLPDKLSIEDWQQMPQNMIVRYLLTVSTEDGTPRAVVKMKRTSSGASVTNSICSFKIGDRVSSIMEYEPTSSKGKVGEIIEIDESEQPYKIRFDDGFDSWYKPHWIEAVEEPDCSGNVTPCSSLSPPTPTVTPALPSPRSCTNTDRAAIISDSARPAKPPTPPQTPSDLAAAATQLHSQPQEIHWYPQCAVSKNTPPSPGTVAKNLALALRLAGATKKQEPDAAAGHKPVDAFSSVLFNLDAADAFVDCQGKNATQ